MTETVELPYKRITGTEVQPLPLGDSNMDAHFITDDEITVEGSDSLYLPLARVTPADPADVANVLAQTAGDEDGRSEWVWLRLRDGTLALATFPQGDTFEEISQAGKAPFYD